MAKELIPMLPCKTVIAAGNTTKTISDACKAVLFNAWYLDLDGQDAGKVVAEIEKRVHNAVVLGTGNIHGIDSDLIFGLSNIDKLVKENSRQA